MQIVGFPMRRLIYFLLFSVKKGDRIAQLICERIYIPDLQEEQVDTIYILCTLHLSSLMRKPTMWFLNRSDTNQAVQAQKMARSLKFQIEEEEKSYYPCSENKGVEQFRSYCEADLRLCFRIGKNPVFIPAGSYS